MERLSEVGNQTVVRCGIDDLQIGVTTSNGSVVAGLADDLDAIALLGTFLQPMDAGRSVLEAEAKPPEWR